MDAHTTEKIPEIRQQSWLADQNETLQIPVGKIKGTRLSVVLFHCLQAEFSRCQCVSYIGAKVGQGPERGRWGEQGHGDREGPPVLARGGEGRPVGGHWGAPRLARRVQASLSFQAPGDFGNRLAAPQR